VKSTREKGGFMKVKKSILKQIQRNVFLGLGIYLILIFAGIYVAFKWTYHKEVKSFLEGIKASLKESILLQGDSNFKEALLFAENQDVKRIYLSLKKEGGDLSRVEEKNKEIFQKYGRLLRDTTEPLIKVLERETGVRPKIHFHLPGPRSFVRTWKKPGEDVKLDDLSGFRFAITEAQKSKKPVLGLEPGREGLVFRTIVPIISEGELLGSVESGQSLDTYLNNFIKERKDITHFAIILKKDLEKIMDFYIKDGKAKLLDQAILYAQSKDFDPKLLKDVLEHAFKEETFEHGKLYFVRIPLKSFKGEEIGYVVLGRDVSELINLFRGMSFLLIALFIVFALVYYFVLNRSLKGCSANLLSTASAMEELASGRGDLTFRLNVKTEDEIGLLAGYFNQFMETLSNIMRSFVEKVKVLFSGAEKLEDDVKTLESESIAFKERAEFISLSSTEILSSMEEVSKSLQELSSAITEISQRAQDSSGVVRETVSTVESTKEKVEFLKQASSEIDEVVNLINSIAEQTNLLALNASIEAARAGEAGKGFAVVANEVKELARQTQEATQTIAEKIRLLQDSSSEVSTGVEEVVNLIKKVEDASTAIAGAVEEQTIVVNTVADHILGVKDKVMINEEQANQIRNSVDNLVYLAERLKEVSSQVKGVANEIKEITSQFKI
jgi:methyl-accepting chemotaxis protein